MCLYVHRLLEEYKEHPETMNLNCMDPLNRSALIAAIENENVELIHILLNAGIKVKVTTYSPSTFRLRFHVVFPLLGLYSTNHGFSHSPSPVTRMLPRTHYLFNANYYVPLQFFSPLCLVSPEKRFICQTNFFDRV